MGGRWLIDPAVHHADRELELAFMTLFGGFPPAMLDGYLAAAPLDAGSQRRRPALQLYHLLVHVALFGAGYLERWRGASTASAGSSGTRPSASGQSDGPARGTRPLDGHGRPRERP